MAGRAPVAVLAALAAALVTAPSGLARERFDIDLFARVGNPGQPEPIAIGPDGLVYVGTNQLGKGDADAPSRIFVYSQQGRLVRDYVLRGQKLDESHGIQGLAFDGRGLLYALDRAADARVVVLDPRTGAQRNYASFADVPRCADAPAQECSATALDAAAEPDYAAFAPDGSLYVTDIEQALIWKVPRGGGRARVWFTDARLENFFGPNGIQFMADGRTLLFVVTASSPVTGNPSAGALYKLPVRGDGSPETLELFWRSRTLDSPDGIAIARSGNVYVPLVGPSQILLLSPGGDELARVPRTPVENLALEAPVDGPGSAAFLGERLLVTNHSGLAGNPRSWAVLDMFAAEPGLPLHYPVTGAKRPLRPKLRLRARPRQILAATAFASASRSRPGRSGGAGRCAERASASPAAASARGGGAASPSSFALSAPDAGER